MFGTLAGVLRRVDVDGTSMVPTLHPGMRVTALRRWRPLRNGDVVMTRDPRTSERWIIKRCASVTANEVTLLGDNELESTDSRVFGPIPVRDVRWIVLVPSAR